VEKGVAELTLRNSDEVRELPLDDIVNEIQSIVDDETEAVLARVVTEPLQ